MRKDNRGPLRHSESGSTQSRLGKGSSACLNLLCSASPTLCSGSAWSKRNQADSRGGGHLSKTESDRSAGPSAFHAGSSGWQATNLKGAACLPTLVCNGNCCLFTHTHAMESDLQQYVLSVHVNQGEKNKRLLFCFCAVS